jgi:hypothetical protein
MQDLRKDLQIEGSSCERFSDWIRSEILRLKIVFRTILMFNEKKISSIHIFQVGAHYTKINLYWQVGYNSE